MQNKQLPFWLILFSLFIVLVVRESFKDGMFMDGMIYTCVGKNLAHGLGTFWHPHFSKTLLSNYHEQPPLLYGMEAVFFKIFGDSMYVERVYGLIIMLVTALMIKKVWELIFRDEIKIKKMAWLPLFFWIIIPVCFWAYANNVEENTMGMFVIISVYFILRAINENRKFWLNLFTGAVALILASMCKGVQGLFPIGLVFFHWLVFRNHSFKRMAIYTLFLVAIPVLFYFLIMMNDVVRSSYELYFHDRYVPTFSNNTATTNNRFEIVIRLFSELLPVVGVMVILLGVFLKNNIGLERIKQYQKHGLFFLLVGLSGSLPLMVTLEQRGFYLVTSLPYFAIGLAVFFAPGVAILMERINRAGRGYKIFKTTAFILMAGIFIFSFADIQKGPSRDREMLHDVHLIGKEIPYGSMVRIFPEMAKDFSLRAYFVRYFYVSLDPSETQHLYYLVDKSLGKPVPGMYEKMPFLTSKYDLYRLRTE